MCDEEMVVVCARLVEGGDYTKNAIPSECSECEHPIMISPTSIEATEGKGRAVCMDCAFKKMAASEEAPKMMPLTQAQVDEIREHLKDKDEPDGHFAY